MLGGLTGSATGGLTWAEEGLKCFTGSLWDRHGIASERSSELLILVSPQGQDTVVFTGNCEGLPVSSTWVDLSV